MLLLISMAVGLSLALAAYVLISDVQERTVVRESLRGLDGYAGGEDVRRRELEQPLAQRLLQPLGGNLADLAQRLVPTGYFERLRHKLIRAGGGTAEEFERFRSVRALTLAAIPLAAFLPFVLVPPPGRQQLVVAVVMVAFCVLGPDAVLNRRVAERQDAIRRSLPDLIDLLTISVEAGLGFEQALDRVVTAVPGPLAEEFLRMLGEVRAGASRSDALRNLEGRIDVAEVRSFALALIQADTFGVSVARVLRAQADDLRVKRRQMAQERAQKAQVKMLVPMVLCIFPPFFVVLLAPAVMSAVHGGL